MINRLQPIIAQKEREVAALKAQLSNEPEHLIAQLLQGKKQRESAKNFKKALSGSSLAVIAEIKRRSPSKGDLAPIANPTDLATTYVAGGANAISVLTDELFFGGNLADLNQVAAALSEQATPILRKDFIIDAVQIAEAIAAGADAILCIVAVMGKQTKTIIEQAKAMNIDVLVEVHNQKELEIAITSGAEIIGVNNRDLSTFEIDTERALQLLEAIPKSIVKVAESGILMPELAQRYYCAGFDAVLIGEALVKSKNPEYFIRACRNA